MFEPVQHDSTFSKLVRSRLARVRASLPARLYNPGDRSTYFRSSSLGYGCGRFEALKIAYDLVTVSEVSAESAYNMAKGTGYHLMHQEVIVPEVAPGAMLGWWSTPTGSLSGREPETGRPILYSRGQAAQKLGGHPTYVEIDLFDPEIGLSGHPDMVLDWGRLGEPLIQGAPKGLEIQEFKTRADNDYMWHQVNSYAGGSALSPHVNQVQAYMMMSGIDQARITYIRKSDEQGKRALIDTYSEFPVQADEAQHGAIRKYVLAYHEVIARAYSGQVPKRSKCTDPGKGAAINCPLRNLCFNGKLETSPTVMHRKDFESAKLPVFEDLSFL